MNEGYDALDLLSDIKTSYRSEKDFISLQVMPSGSVEYEDVLTWMKEGRKYYNWQLNFDDGIEVG